MFEQNKPIPNHVFHLTYLGYLELVLIIIHVTELTKMDLVSSTLDKYLKHRFNGTGIDRAATNGLCQTHNNSTVPKIFKISINNNRPCCVALRNDLSYLAAGFENSHIYLWNFKNDPQITLSISDMFVLLAHSGSIYNIVFVDGQDLMISCSEDTTIRLWCLKTKCNVLVYRGHNYPIWTLDIGPQGSLFASGSMDATARLWRLDNITPIRIFCGHDEDVECIKFHPNEKYLATGSSDSTVRLWSIADGKMVRLMVGHQSPISSLSFFPDGKFLASASKSGVIKVWNLTTNTVAKELSVPASFSISFSPDQKFVATCGVDNILCLWLVDGSEMVEKKRIDFCGQTTRVILSHFHRDNKLFIVHHKENESKQN